MAVRFKQRPDLLNTGMLNRWERTHDGTGLYLQFFLAVFTVQAYTPLVLSLTSADDTSDGINPDCLLDTIK